MDQAHDRRQLVAGARHDHGGSAAATASKDFVTGKRYMAHNGHDPGEREPLGIYWYEYMRDGGKRWNG